MLVRSDVRLFRKTFAHRCKCCQKLQTSSLHCVWCLCSLCVSSGSAAQSPMRVSGLNVSLRKAQFCNSPRSKWRGRASFMLAAEGFWNKRIPLPLARSYRNHTLNTLPAVFSVHPCTFQLGAEQLVSRRSFGLQGDAWSRAFGSVARAALLKYFDVRIHHRLASLCLGTAVTSWLEGAA